jgi:hypothetical protein
VAALRVVDALPLSTDAVDEVIPRYRTVGDEAQSRQYPEYLLATRIPSITAGHAVKQHSYYGLANPAALVTTLRRQPKRPLT